MRFLSLLLLPASCLADTVTMKDGTTHELPANSPDLTDDAMRPLIARIEPLGETAPAIVPMAGPEPVDDGYRRSLDSAALWSRRAARRGESA